MKEFFKDRPKAILAALSFLISWIVYLLTMAPTVSFWDCGEFIATSYTLGVPHPPGSPLFLLLGRFFSMLPTSSDIAFRVNLISPLASGIAVMLLFLIIIRLIKMYYGELDTQKKKFAVYAGAFIGAMTFAFTDSHWFNAVEAEVYAMSTFFTALVVWLILVWAEKSEEPGSGRYILMIMYIIGLASGVHLLNLLALPFITMIIYFKKTDFEIKSFLVLMAITFLIYLSIYIGIIKGLPQIADNLGLFWVALIIIAVFIGGYMSIRSRNYLLSLAFISAILIIIGYSTYSTIFIRSAQDPAIDENDPETTHQAVAYLNREQYGERNFYDRKKIWEESKRKPGARIARKVNSTAEFVLKYQINYMYIRYFNWQFIGRDNSRVDFFQFILPFPFIIGLFGAFHHFARDKNRALSVLGLFIMTGLMIILYLNQDDPQPRERDYSYVGSFFAFSIWIGIGVSALIEKIQEIKNPELVKKAQWGIAGVLLVILPVNLLMANYHTHDRTGNYVASDYSRNILETCDPYGIIFTNGDNDTFPLWYLQEVEGVRKDVRVVNLSLLNTPWYIKQLRDMEPKVPITYTDEEIDRLSVIPWQTKKISIPTPEDIEKEYGAMTIELKPTISGRGLRVQDIMILHILSANRWKKPIYFAVTVSPENKLGLDKYMQMEGLAFRVHPHKVSRINVEKMKKNLYEKYVYRNLGNEDVYFNPNIKKLLQNYRSAFLQIAIDAYMKKDTTEILQALEQMEKAVPEATIPITNKDVFLQVGRLYNEAGRKEELKRRMEEVLSRKNLTLQDYLTLSQIYMMDLHDYESAAGLLEQARAAAPENPELLSYLISAYNRMQNYERTMDLLNAWIQNHPNDKGAQNMLKDVQEKFRKQKALSDTVQSDTSM